MIGPVTVIEDQRDSTFANVWYKYTITEKLIQGAAASMI